MAILRSSEPRTGELRFPRGIQTALGPLRPQAVGEPESLIELPHVGEALERSELVHHDPWAGRQDGSPHSLPVQSVTTTGSAPADRRASALVAVRVVPTTSCPCRASRGTRRRPTAPVAPATK